MTNENVILIVVLAAVVLVAIWLITRRRRSQHLRTQFGSEYDRALKATGNRAKAEAELERRERRVQKLALRSLPPQQRDSFAKAWLAEQASFVDDPRGAIRNADRLVGELMSARGYPVGDFEQRAADISVEHPKVVDNYRVAHAIALKDAAGSASTEELRKGMVHFRALFEDLLESPVVEHHEVRG